MKYLKECLSSHLMMGNFVKKPLKRTVARLHRS